MRTSVNPHYHKILQCWQKRVKIKIFPSLEINRRLATFWRILIEEKVLNLVETSRVSGLALSILLSQTLSLEDHQLHHCSSCKSQQPLEGADHHKSSSKGTSSQSRVTFVLAWGFILENPHLQGIALSELIQSLLYRKTPISKVLLENQISNDYLILQQPEQIIYSPLSVLCI